MHVVMSRDASWPESAENLRCFWKIASSSEYCTVPLILVSFLLPQNTGGTDQSSNPRMVPPMSHPRARPLPLRSTKQQVKVQSTFELKCLSILRKLRMPLQSNEDPNDRLGRSLGPVLSRVWSLLLNFPTRAFNSDPHSVLIYRVTSKTKKN